MAAAKADRAGTPEAPSSSAPTPPRAPGDSPGDTHDGRRCSSTRQASGPWMPPGIPPYLAPGARWDHVAWLPNPFLWANAQVQFERRRRGVHETRTVTLLAPLCRRSPRGRLGGRGARGPRALGPADPSPSTRRELRRRAAPSRRRPKTYASWTKDFARWLYDIAAAGVDGARGHRSHLRARRGRTSLPHPRAGWPSREEARRRQGEAAAEVRAQGRRPAGEGAARDDGRGPRSRNRLRIRGPVGRVPIGSQRAGCVARAEGTSVPRTSAAPRRSLVASAGRKRKTEDVKRAEANVQRTRSN